MTIPWWMVTQGVVDLVLLGALGYLLAALRRARTAAAGLSGQETKAAVAEFTALAESLLTAWKASQVHPGGTGGTEEKRSNVRTFERSEDPPRPGAAPQQPPRTSELPRPTAPPSVPGSSEPSTRREGPGPREAGEGMPLSKRLAILRQVEKGLPPEAVAREIGLPVGEVRLVARLYGRGGDGPAGAPQPPARAEGGAGREMWGRPQGAWTHGGVMVHGAEWA
jgi:hypothetical protein